MKLLVLSLAALALVVLVIIAMNCGAAGNGCGWSI